MASNLSNLKRALNELALQAAESCRLSQTVQVFVS
jgi:hypothetical protein